MPLRRGNHRWLEHIRLQGVYARHVLDHLGNVGDIDGLEKYLVRPHTMNILLNILERPWISHRTLVSEVVDPENEESEKRTLKTRIKCLEAYGLIETDKSSDCPWYKATWLARNAVKKIDTSNLVPAILSLLRVMCSESSTFKQALRETLRVVAPEQGTAARESLPDYRKAYRQLTTLYSKGIALEINAKYRAENGSIRIRKKKVFRDQQLVSTLLLAAGLGAATSRIVAHRIYGSMTSLESAQKIVANRIVADLEDEGLVTSMRYHQVPVTARGKALVFDDPAEFRSATVHRMHPCVEILDAGVDLLTRSERGRLQPAAILLVKSIVSKANGNRLQREMRELLAQGAEEIVR